MSFTSLSFFVLFVIILIPFCFIKNKHARLILLLIVNLLFYCIGGGCISLLILILFCAFIYAGGLLLGKYKNKVLLAVLIMISLMPLFLLKYLNYYLKLGGISLSIFTTIGLPIGISFFSLQGISYLVEVFKGNIVVDKNPLYVGVYLSFFSIITSGPFEEPNHIFEQLKKDYLFDYDKTVIGLRNMGIGLFLKLFVANSLGYIVDIYYSNPGQDYYSIMLLVSTIFFAFELYADFYGYSLMAKGSAAAVGIEIIDNFHQPYLSSSISSFWSRWHISFQKWLTRYIFIPLGGSRTNRFRIYLNIIIVFLVSGLWHGSGFTFFIWGGLNAIYIIVERIFKWNNKDKTGAKRIIGFIYTCLLIGLSWIFFRANNVQDALIVFKQIFVNLPQDLISILTKKVSVAAFISTQMTWLIRFGFSMIGIIFIIVLDIKDRKYGSLAIRCSNWKVGYRFILYFALICIAVGFGVWGGMNEFMYAQF